MNKIVFIIYLVLFILNTIIAMVMYHNDKKKASRGMERTKEKNLFLIAILNGGLGAVLGSILFHHKTNKKYFVIVNFTCLIVQVATLSFLFFKGGFIG